MGFCLPARGCGRGWFAVALGVVTLGSACAQRSSPPGPLPVSPVARDMPVYQPGPGDSPRIEAPAIAAPAGALSLRDAIGLALLHAPDLASFAWEVRAREASLVQAGRPPNPLLGLLAEDFGAARMPRAASEQPVQPQVTVQLSQVVELGGKRAARQGVAALNRDLAAWDYETARIDVLTRVTHAFVDALAAQDPLALHTQALQIVEQTQQTVMARVTAGAASPIEQTRADVALASARVDAERAERLAVATRNRLAAFWASPVAGFGSVVGNLDQLPAPPSFAQLEARVAANPAVARWAVEVQQRQATVTLERARRVPDVSVTAGYKRFTDISDNAFLVGATIALPIWDRNQGGIAEAGSRLGKAYEDRRAAQMRVFTGLTEAYRALATADAEVTALRTLVLPGSRQAFEAVSEGYRLGRFGYLDVLDAQRALVTAGGQQLRALTDYHHAVAEIEQLTGTPLNDPAVATPPVATQPVPTPRD